MAQELKKSNLPFEDGETEALREAPFPSHTRSEASGCPTGTGSWGCRGREGIPGGRRGRQGHAGHSGGREEVGDGQEWAWRGQKLEGAFPSSHLGDDEPLHRSTSAATCLPSASARRAPPRPADVQVSIVQASWAEAWCPRREGATWSCIFGGWGARLHTLPGPHHSRATAQQPTSTSLSAQQLSAGGKECPRTAFHQLAGSSLPPRTLWLLSQAELPLHQP